MSDTRDPAAVLRHAVQVGDWRLAELLARLLAGEFNGQTSVAQRAYDTLVVRLGLGDPGNYHRR
jgi:hypothetical protein